ncbi:hypothetical protein EFR49_08475 [Latilactobacillus curvatus]|uniref:hypothetical protein n=1 Tax=Latilactobacillus curvatus TaxID=28038 RepID=UPI0021A8D442|nr:hypothetical protein [Latilactobacillus curvatus]MCT3529539.1 hypothetical protein [Latilactobacillus curvatus]
MKNKYILCVNDGETNSAGSKAKDDITKFLVQDSYTEITVKDVHMPKVKKLLYGKRMINKALEKVNDGVFIFQYPLYSRYFSNLIVSNLKKRNVKRVCIIHDIESLRFFKNEESGIGFEKDFFNQFDYLIVHNSKMGDWLKNNGIETKQIILDIFDYDNPQKLLEPTLNQGIIYAGNLKKAEFLKNIKSTVNINVFGINPADRYPSNVIYKGVRTPEELPRYLEGSFGLVWDGDSTRTCTGMYGEYLKYNNPHKVSLYLSSGIPVIVWAESAMAKYIRDNNLGLVVDSLENIDEIIRNITEEQYEIMKNNVKEIAKYLRQGGALKHALNEINRIG